MCVNGNNFIRRNYKLCSVFVLVSVFLYYCIFILVEVVCYSSSNILSNLSIPLFLSFLGLVSFFLLLVDLREA